MSTRQWDNYGEFLNSAELQEMLDVSKETFLKIVKQPGFPKFRASGGRKYIYVKSALMEYFHKQAVSA
jgi:predicted DNA-binding transcriptional regulator AlpA